MAVSLEERVAALEAEVERLEEVKSLDTATADVPWWEQIRGTFKDDSMYDEAMALGRAYRESLRPPDYETADEAPSKP